MCTPHPSSGFDLSKYDKIYLLFNLLDFTIVRDIWNKIRAMSRSRSFLRFSKFIVCSIFVERTAEGFYYKSRRCDLRNQALVIRSFDITESK